MTNRLSPTDPLLTATGSSDTIATLEPFEMRSTSQPGARRRRGGRRLHEFAQRQHETFQQNLIFDNNIRSQDFKKYYTVSAKTGENLSEINVIKANKDLEKKLDGPPQKITETRTGELLIEVKNKKQGDLLCALTHLDTCEIDVKPHNKLNQTKGTIRYANRPRYSPDQLLQELKRYQVVELYQLKKRVGGILEDLPVYILTFESCSLPENVAIGWTRCSVREYVPRPRRCFKCQRFGHGAKTCRSDITTCANCGDEAHGLPCNKPKHCANCQENHATTSNQCFYYIMEQEILAVQTKQHISYPEAKRTITSRHIQPNRSFATVVKAPPPAAARPQHHEEIVSQTGEPSKPPPTASTTSNKNTSECKSTPTRETTASSKEDAVQETRTQPEPAEFMKPGCGRRGGGNANASPSPARPSRSGVGAGGAITRSSQRITDNPEKSKSLLTRDDALAGLSEAPSVRRREMSVDRNRRDQKRKGVADERSLSLERAAKRAPSPRKSLLLDLPMPPGFPTHRPPQPSELPSSNSSLPSLSQTRIAVISSGARPSATHSDDKTQSIDKD